MAEKKVRGRLRVSYKMKAKLQKEIMSSCPFCSNEEVEHFQVHHIDNNPSNNIFENLIMLCPNCHSRITKGDIAQSDVFIKKELLGNEDFYRGLSETQSQASKDAAIVIILESIKEQYYNAGWKKRNKIIGKLDKYVSHAGKEATYEILLFLERICDTVRAGIPLSLIRKIFSLTTSFFPYSYQSKDKRYDFEIGNICINIGFAIAYDSVIYLKQLSYIPCALTIWKHTYIGLQKKHKTNCY